MLKDSKTMEEERTLKRFYKKLEIYVHQKKYFGEKY